MVPLNQCESGRVRNDLDFVFHLYNANLQVFYFGDFGGIIKGKKQRGSFLFFHRCTYLYLTTCAGITLCKNLFFRRPLLVQVVAGSGATCQCRPEGLGGLRNPTQIFPGIHAHRRLTLTLNNVHIIKSSRNHT